MGEGRGEKNEYGKKTGGGSCPEKKEYGNSWGSMIGRKGKSDRSEQDIGRVGHVVNFFALVPGPATST